MRELLPVAAQGYSRPLARLGERNLTNYLQERGYFFATVTSRCEPADCRGPNLRVLYDVQPGQRLDLEEIRLEGTNEISLGDVSGDFRSQTASFVGGIPFLKNLPLIGGYARGITSNDRLASDREAVRRRLVDLGYRSARVETRLAFRPESDNLTVIFAVNEGPRSTISEVALKGNAVIPYSELRRAVPVKDNDAFSLTLARNGAQEIRKYYADRGYLDARAELSVEELAENRLLLVYNVNEGSRNVASEVLITGQTKTREESIRRFLAFNLGDTLTPALIRQTQRDLYATGAFREVNIRTEALPGGDENARRVTVGITEARPLLFVYGLGYSTDDGARASTQVTNNNLFGRANTASIRLRGSRSEQLAQFQYTDLRPFNTKWATTISTFYNRNTNLQNFARRKLVDGGFEDIGGRSFGINRFAAFLQTERKLSETTSIRFRYNFENARLSNAQNIPIEEIARNQQSIRLGILAAGFTRDTRDSAINATRGQLFSAEHSVAARFLGGNEAFNKLFLNYQNYKTLPSTTPLLRDSVLAAAARVGLAERFGATSPNATPETADLLPISERFFAGGATTLRGFRFEAAGPQGILEPRNAQELPTLVPVGGNALAVFNFELRYPLTRRLRLVPFYDLGNAFRRVSDFSFGRMTNTVGLGLRFNTPIGPVGVDYGYLLDPPAFTTASGGVLRQQRGVIHIRFGQTF
jgi:outer membrane protein insertion porin family